MKRAAWLIAALALVVTACGGSGDPDDEGPSAAASAAASTGGGGGDADDPVRVTVAGTTYGFPSGTCNVSDEGVSASAGGIEGEFAGVEVLWLRDGSDARFMVVNSGVVSDPPAPFELWAEPGRPETSWEVVVDGTSAVIEAHMANELPAAQGDPDVASFDVTIRIDCAERGFGGLQPQPSDDEPPPSEAPPSVESREATIVLELAGNTYRYTYLGCPLTEPAISLVVVDASLNRLFVSNGEVQLVLPDGTTYTRENTDFVVAGSRATWIGDMEGSSGEEPAKITIAC